jgi:predicted DCC family thiol-disulfide oxidoreductase YuxK
VNAGIEALSGTPLMLFDGTCGLCNGWVDFVIRFDRSGRFRFTPLQSETGRNMLAEVHLSPDYRDSIVLFQEGRIYTSSTAVLRILRELGLPFSLAYVFIVIPSFIREAVYRFIARNRYKWFGRRESCRLPTPEERERFL